MCSTSLQDGKSLQTGSETGKDLSEVSSNVFFDRAAFNPET